MDLAGPGALHGEWSEEWGRQATHILLRAQPDTDAIFCGSDQIARGVADMLRESSHRVPADIALVGFDNWDVHATACRPPLTTVDMNLTQLGRYAAEQLLAAIAGEPSHGAAHAAMPTRRAGIDRHTDAAATRRCVRPSRGAGRDRANGMTPTTSGRHARCVVLVDCATACSAEGLSG